MGCTGSKFKKPAGYLLLAKQSKDKTYYQIRESLLLAHLLKKHNFSLKKDPTQQMGTEILYLGKRKLRYSYEIADLHAPNISSIMSTLKVLLNLNKVVVVGDQMTKDKVKELLYIFKQNRISPSQVLVFMGSIEEFLSQTPSFDLKRIFGLGLY